MDDTKYSEITVQLTGQDGNAFAILGCVQRAMKSHGVPSGEIKQFFAEATAGDYDHLLRTCMEWVDVR